MFGRNKRTSRKSAKGKPAEIRLPAGLTKREQKQVKEIIERARKDDGMPRTAQQSIPFQRMFPDGICRVSDNYYTKTIHYQDINYQLAQDEDKTAIFEEWCSFLNFFDSSIHFELSFLNMATDAESFEQSIRIPSLPEGQYELAYGYCFEETCLYAEPMGIGTVMLAASLSRQTFEKAMDVKENEVMPVASPIGYPAAKRSIRESLMRKGLKADERIAFESLFFEETFDRGLTREKAGDFAEPLEMMRLAPSAGNKQPWMAVVCGRAVHFYENRTMKVSPLGDIQKVDVGIGLAHFDLTRKENGLSGRFTFEDPGLKTPENVQYVVSFERD